MNIYYIYDIYFWMDFITKHNIFIRKLKHFLRDFIFKESLHLTLHVFNLAINSIVSNCRAN